MAEIREDGYVSIRTSIVENWNKLILKDEAENSVAEIDLTENNWIHEVDTEQVFDGYDGQGRPLYKDVEIQSNAQMEIEVVVTGTDIDLPATVVSSTIVDTNLNKEVATEEFTAFSFETSNDELTVTHQINVPQGWGD